MSYAAALNFFEHSLWLQTLEVLESSKKSQDYDLVTISKSRIKEAKDKNLVEKIEIITEINNLLAEIVYEKWDEMPKDLQVKIEELAQVELRESQKPFRINLENLFGLVLIWLEILRNGNNLLAKHQASVANFTTAVFTMNGSNKIILSDVDRDLFLDALENPPEPPKELKLGIEEFRRKYKI